MDAHGQNCLFSTQLATVTPQPASGPVRPSFGVDPLLILAHGPKRCSPEQKRGVRVSIRLTPIDPRVDPTAPPLPSWERRPAGRRPARRRPPSSQQRHPAGRRPPASFLAAASFHLSLSRCASPSIARGSSRRPSRSRCSATPRSRSSSSPPPASSTSTPLQGQFGLHPPELVTCLLVQSNLIQPVLVS